MSEHLVDVEVRKVMRFTGERRENENEGKTKRLISVGNKPDNSHLLVTGVVWRSGNYIDRSRDRFTVITKHRFWEKISKQRL